MSRATSHGPLGPSPFWLAYGQITAILGAFSLLVFLTDFVDAGLNGVVQEAFKFWTENVRPVLGHPLTWLVAFLPASWHFVVSDRQKDYLAVGLVSTSSLLRAYMLHPGGLGSLVQQEGGWLWVGLALVQLVVLWPIYLIVAPFTILRRLFGGTDELLPAAGLRLYVLWLAPLVYLVLLLGANAWLGSYCEGMHAGELNAVLCGPAP